MNVKLEKSNFIFIKLFYEFCLYPAIPALEMQFLTLLCAFLMAFRPCVGNLYFFSFGLDFGVCFICAIFCFYLYIPFELLLYYNNKSLFCIYNPVLLYQAFSWYVFVSRAQKGIPLCMYVYCLILLGKQCSKAALQQACTLMPKCLWEKFQPFCTVYRQLVCIALLPPVEEELHVVSGIYKYKFCKQYAQ